MLQKQVISEIDYHRAQRITEILYHMDLITFEEYEKITKQNRCTFSPILVELLPKPTKETKLTVSDNNVELRETI